MRKKARTVLGLPKKKAAALGFTCYADRSYSPTACATTLRTACALTAANVFRNITGGDVKQAYGLAAWPKHLKKLLGRMPQGYDMYDEHGNLLACEVGNLYGHILAGKHWYLHVRKWLIDYGFEQSKHDPCFFVLTVNGSKLAILLYVDDLLCFDNDEQLRAKWAEAWEKDFEWTDFGTNLHEFCSIRIRNTDTAVTLDMVRYIEDCVAENFPGGPHHAYTLPAAKSLEQDVRAAFAARDTSEADTAIGIRFRHVTMQCLFACTNVRPEVALAVGLLTRVQAWPNAALLRHAERVLIYLHGTPEMVLTYAKNTSSTISLEWAPRVVITAGDADANFEVEHSTSGFVFYMSSAAISWCTKKQDTIATSTYHAEVVAGSLAACEAIFIRGICADVGVPQPDPIVLSMDSTSAINLSYDPMMHSKAKHIRRKDLYIRELVEREIVKPVAVDTADNSADAMTKVIDLRKLFMKHRARFYGIPIA